MGNVLSLFPSTKWAHEYSKVCHASIFLVTNINPKNKNKNNINYYTMQIHFTLSIQYLIFFVFIFLSAMKDEDI
jgi:hypothetical protein